MPELNREDIIKALECCKSPKLTKCNGCPREEEDGLCMYRLNEDALALINSQEQRIKQLTEENESLGIENEVQRLNLGNTRDDLNNAECDVARLKRENTALEREVERLKADAVPRREVVRYRVKADGTLEMIPTIESVRQDVAREIFEEIEKIISKNTQHDIKYGQLMVSGYNGRQIARFIDDLKKKYIGE